MPTTVIAKCTPSLGAVSLWWSRMTESIFWPNNQGKAIFYLRDKVGREIAEVRNAIVDLVLEYHRELDQNGEKAHPVSHFLWIDDDVFVFEGCLLELLHQQADICSGVYFTRLPGNLCSPLIYPTKHGGTAPFQPDQIMENVWGHGMGLCLVRREVYERMALELDLGKDKYGRPKWYHTSNIKELSQDWNGITDTGGTEDTYFLDRAHRIGYKSTVVTTKHAFGFHYDAKKDVGYPEAQWKQWVAGEPIRWKTPQGEVIWE